MSTAVERWVEQARYDLDTARAMLKSGRYLYVLFCCQQAVEKILKAIIVRRTMDFPPRIHNLLRLAEIAGIKMEPAREDLLGELSGYYIQSRYPEEIESLAQATSREIAQDALDKTEEVIEWLYSILK
jgi:HEPN domain-containing protein